jgi:hypothetical protein
LLLNVFFDFESLAHCEVDLALCSLLLQNFYMALALVFVGVVSFVAGQPEGYGKHRDGADDVEQQWDDEEEPVAGFGFFHTWLLMHQEADNGSGILGGIA